MATRLFRGAFPAALFGLLFTLLTASLAFAQSTTGTLKGDVVDQADSALAGVKLTLDGENMQGGRELVTGEDGVFRFLALPPGTYRLVVEKEGFKTIIRQNLSISLGRTVTLKLVMELPEVGETVEVTDTRPVVDTESTAMVETLNHDFLRNLPSGRSFQDVVQFLPGVSGGANPNINGGTLQSNQYYLDGAATTDPVTGTFAMNFNFDAIEDLEVITAGYDARYNQGLGGTINIVTKSGGNTFEGDFNAYLLTSALTGRGNEYVRVPQADLTDLTLNASLGGPIVKDRFWFYISYSFLRARYLPGGRQDIGRDFARFPLVPETRTAHFILAKLTAAPFARNKFTLSFRADPTWWNNDLQSIFILPEAERRWRQGGVGINLSHEVRIGGRAVLTTTANYNYSTIFIEPMAWADCQEKDSIGICTQDDPYMQSPQFTGTAFGLTHGSYGRYDLDRRHRFVIKSDFEVGVDRLLGSHTIQAGFELDPLWTNRFFGWVGNTLLQKEPIDKNNDGQIDGVDEISDLDSYENVGRYVIVNENSSNELGILFNLYAQDRWVPTRGLTFNFGLRWTHARLENNLGDAIIDTDGFSWGVGGAWDPFRDGKTSLSVNYAQISDPGILSLSGYINQQQFNFEYYPWESDQQRWAEDSSRASTPASNITHPDFVVPRTQEVFAAVRREIARDMRAEVQFVWRRFNNQWEDDEVNVIWNDDGTNVVGFRNGTGSDIYRLRTPGDSKRNYWGITLLVRKQLSDNFELLGSYTFSRLTTNTAGVSQSSRVGTSTDYDNPVQRYQEDGLAGFDRPHIVKLQAAYDNPNQWKISEKFAMGWSLGGAFSFQSGRPLDRLRYNEWYQGYTNYVFKRGTRERLPATVDLDLRAALAMSIAGTQVDIIVQVFNILNALEVTSADDRAIGTPGDASEILGLGNAGPRFASPTSVQTPRRFEVGLRFSF